MMRNLTRTISAILLATAVAAGFSGCGHSNTKAIDNLVTELNSSEFRAREVHTGLFTDSQTAIDGSELVITLLCREGIDLTTVDHAQIPALRQSAITDFKAQLANQRFKEGMEALRDNDMTLKLRWKDVAGETIDLSFKPDEIL